MKTKICNVCKIRKSINNFCLDNKVKSKIHYRCRKCVHNYWIQNKHWLSKKAKLWRLNNKEFLKEYDRQKHINNRERRNKRSSLWYKNHKSIALTKANIYLKLRKQYDFKFKIQCNLRTRIYWALNKNVKSLSTMFLIGCEIDYLMYHLQTKFKKGMSWNNYGIGGWEIDHIKPCAKFDLSKKSEQLKCFNYMNLQPLWKKEHLQKTTKERRIK